MSDFTKADGAKIKITFSEPLTGTVTGNEAHFTVTSQEYNYVPGGTLGAVTHTVTATAVGNTANELVLTVKDTERFESAVDQITVAYDGGGTLIGDGGAVLAFTQTFTPVGLVPKPHQNDAEHIEISSVAAAATLTKINYTDTAAQDQGHIEIASITATGTLTKVSDI